MDPSFLLAFPLLLALSTPCSACICKILHPQTFYCMSDIGELTETLEKCPPRRRSCPGEQKHRGGGALVIRTVFKETAWGTLKSMTHFFLLSVVVADIIGQGRGTFLKRNYKIRVTEILKAPQNVGKIDHLYTPKDWNKCGYEVRTPHQSQLLIAGYLRRGSLHFTRCHLVYFWNSLTREQKLGFRAGYERGCKCKVQPCLFCWRDCPEPDVTDCVWQQRGCDYQIWEGNHSLYSICAPAPSGHCEWTRINVSSYQPPITTPPTTSMNPSME
uniref:NTR domain-containing protein n=1 Tax=Sus scrofa TaxID=9823 RepID=A0A8D1VRX3_PIG